MPWRPSYKGEAPTLGWSILDWMGENLASPDKGEEYIPFQPTNEQAQFLLRLYELDPLTGRRRYRRAVLSRSKGWGKSPLLSAWIIAEALAPVVPDGWDAHGQPVARPWSDLRTVLCQVAATSIEQTANAWDPLLEMVRNGPILRNYRVDPMDTFVALPFGRSRIEPVTAAASSREGNRPVACLLDQTESWTKTNGGRKLADALRRNLGKTDGVSVEAPNAYFPGLESVAEESARYAAAIADGTVRETGLLYDHREAPLDTDMTNDASLRRGLLFAYGDSAIENGGWVNLDRIMAEVRDPGTAPQDARAFYLGQITHASDSWITAPEWGACKSETSLVDRDMVTLGFDGGVRDDSTALVACRVSDGHLKLLGCWEKPVDIDPSTEWEVDREAVDAAVYQAMKQYKVIGMYADPALWQDYIDSWSREFGKGMKLRSQANKPLEWWTNKTTPMVAALERFNTAVRNRDLSYNGSDRRAAQLTRHVLNARRREARLGVTIAKAHPKSKDKIDAAMAAVLAYEARSDALAQGLNKKRTNFVAQRVQ